jgi:hypothetical protein
MLSTARIAPLFPQVLLSCGICGMGYAALCGQPMTFVAPTGLTLAFTAALGTGWLLNMSWFREMMRQVTPDGDVPAVHAWSMLAIGTLYALSLLLPGSMLAVAAACRSRAGRSR